MGKYICSASKDCPSHARCAHAKPHEYMNECEYNCCNRGEIIIGCVPVKKSKSLKLLEKTYRAVYNFETMSPELMEEVKQHLKKKGIEI